MQICARVGVYVRDCVSVYRCMQEQVHEGLYRNMQVLAYSGIHMGVTEVSRFTNNEFLEYFLELES